MVGERFDVAERGVEMGIVVKLPIEVGLEGRQPPCFFFLRNYIKAQNFTSIDESLIVGTMSSCPPSPSERGSEASTSGQDSDFSSKLCCSKFHPKRIVNNGVVYDSLQYHQRNFDALSIYN